MISAKVDFLQLLVVKATVGRLAVGEFVSLRTISQNCPAGIAVQVLSNATSISAHAMLTHHACTSGHALCPSSDVNVHSSSMPQLLFVCWQASHPPGQKSTSSITELWRPSQSRSRRQTEPKRLTLLQSPRLSIRPG